MARRAGRSKTHVMGCLKRLEETHDASPDCPHVFPFEDPCRGMIEVMRVIRERDGEEFATGLQAAREALCRGDLDAVAFVLGVRVEEIQLISGSLHHSRPAPSL